LPEALCRQIEDLPEFSDIPRSARRYPIEEADAPILTEGLRVLGQLTDMNVKGGEVGVGHVQNHRNERGGVTNRPERRDALRAKESGQ
jgi:hypothetical protein